MTTAQPPYGVPDTSTGEPPITTGDTEGTGSTGGSTSDGGEIKLDIGK